MQFRTKGNLFGSTMSVHVEWTRLVILPVRRALVAMVRSSCRRFSNVLSHLFVMFSWVWEVGILVRSQRIVQIK